MGTDFLSIDILLGTWEREREGIHMATRGGSE
jgi:hypothetical protein